ncbi:GNAT family N-acetyltransferase [Mumia sp. zg.B53]|uniref:GNAT family N-acetyltransferase n=1 Tax=Mumia sp. zg.B53 TaxID=2855449 RepID=UPI001C6ECD19|nr:GNAT family N-acetyltransferase [Mumia sp. zg.B53]MBW9215653.1 GNAT family N-acetyltransferase [Mumia sp. zg.B53]
MTSAASVGAGRLLVRPVRPEEYARAGEIVVTAYRSEGYLRFSDGSEDHAYAAKLADVATRAADSVVLVVELDGRLVGSVTWCTPGSSMRELATRHDQGEFRMLGVDPGAVGRGVGTALITWCLDRAHQEGLAEVVISSLPEMTAAHRLYRRHGFVRRTDLDWSPVPGTQLVGFSRPVA